jgi:hypothetical protein
MRITSRLNLTLALAYSAAIVGLIISLCTEKRTPFFFILTISIIPLVGVFVWFFLNFIDIYYSEETGFLCKFYGRVLTISRISRIGKLPFILKATPMQFTIGYIVYYEDADKKRIKFVAIRAKSWDLIEKLKNDFP